MSCCVQAMTFSPAPSSRARAATRCVAARAPSRRARRGPAASPPVPKRCPGSGSAPPARTHRRRSSASAPKACCASRRPWRWTAAATCMSPTSSATSCRSSAPPAPTLGEWGSYGGGHGQFGPIGGLATDARGQRLRGRLRATTASRSSTPNGNFITAWGHRGSELGDFNFGSSQNYTQPPGGGIAVAGELRVRGRLAATTASSASTSKATNRCMGRQGQRARAVLLPARRGRQRERGARRRRRQPPHREVHARAAPTKAPSAPTARARAVRLPLRRRPRCRRRRVRRRRHQRPHRQARPRSSRSRAHGAGSARNRASSRSRARWPATRRATPTSPTRPTTASRCSTQAVTTCARSAPPRARPGVFDRAARARRPTPPAGCSCPTPTATASSASPRAATRSPAPGRTAGGHESGLQRTRRASRSTRAARSMSPTKATRASCTCGATAPTCPNSAAPPTSAARSSTARARWRCPPATGDLYVADTGHNRVLVYSPDGALLAKWGAGGGDGAAGSGPGAVQPSARRSRSRRSGNIYVADTDNNRIVELSPGGACSTSGARAARRDGRFHTPDRGRGRRRGARLCRGPRKQSRRGVRRSGDFLVKWGLRGIGPGRTLPAERDRGGLRRQTSTWPTPTTIACSASTRPRPRTPAAWPPARWPPPLDVAPVLQVSLPRTRACSRAARWRSRQLPAWLQDPRDRDPLRRAAVAATCR